QVSIPSYSVTLHFLDVDDWSDNDEDDNENDGKNGDAALENTSLVLLDAASQKSLRKLSMKMRKNREDV
ncbi:hypothetical protein A2U01_0068262, partial [Trifolium medium]|nr:hypothetical protein [Trifolium medium]